MAGASLKEITSSITKLPTLPEVAMQLVCAVSDPETSGKDVAALLTREPTLAAQVLKLVNSAYFGLMEKVSDVHRAVTLLGFRQVRNIALGASVIRVFGSNGAEGRFDFKAFWHHSLAVANISTRVAKALPSTDPDQAYMVGLIHDIGKLILFQFRNDDFTAVLNRAKESSSSFFEAEKEILGTRHDEVGAWLIEEWGLEQPIADGLRWHHTPEKYAAQRLAGVCRLANYICGVKFLPCPGDFNTLSLDQPVWEPLDLTQADFLAVVNVAEEEIERAGEMLQSIL